MYVRDALNRIRNNSLEIYEKIKSPLNSVSELFDDIQCFVSAKFGPFMIFLKRWVAYNKIKHEKL